MKELLQAGVPVPVAIKAAKQSGNVGDDDAQYIINRQHSALTLMSMILDDVRRGYPKLSAELDRIIQQAIDNAGTGPELAERLEQETWIGVDWSQSFILKKQAEAVEKCAEGLTDSRSQAWLMREANQLRNQADEAERAGGKK